MLVNTNNNIFSLTVIILSKILTLCYPVHIETLAMIYLNSCVALKYQREKLIDVSQLHKI